MSLPWSVLYLSSYISSPICKLSIEVTLQFAEEAMLGHLSKPLLTLFPWNWMFSTQESAYLEGRPQRAKDAIWGRSKATKPVHSPSLFENTGFICYCGEWEIQAGTTGPCHSLQCAEALLGTGCWEYSNESSFGELAASREDKASPWTPRTPGRKL